MTHEHLNTPPSAERGLPAIEFAGSLQATINKIPTRDYSLYLEQREALEAIGESLLDGEQRGYIEMATSTGKTAIESLVAEAAVRAGRRVLMLAPSIETARQLGGGSHETPAGIGKFTNLLETANVRRHFGHYSGTKQAEVVISTYAGFLNDYKSDHEKLGEFDVVIADECHRSLGVQTSEALQNSFPGAVKLGFSATPDYAADRRSEEVYDNRLFEFSLLNAIEEGKTAPIRALIYETDDTLTTLDHRQDYSEVELSPLAHSQARNATAMELTRAFVKDGRQGVLACIPGEKNFHARLLADLLNAEGIRAAAIGSHISDEERTLLLKSYEVGDIDVLTFTRALSEGWDSAKASFAINLSPTASPVRTTQLLGRILRTKPDDLDSIYVDFLDKKQGVANKMQYTALHALDLEYIDGTRLLGRYNSQQNDWVSKPLPSIDYMSERLRNKLIGMQGRALSDITVKPVHNPLFKEWNDKLAGEGLNEELEYNDILPPSLNRRIEKAYQEYVEEHDEAPVSIETLRDAIGGVQREREHAMGYYGLRIAMDKVTDDDMRNVDDTVAAVDSSILKSTLRAVLDTMSEREAGIVSMRFGLDDGESKTLDETGMVYGVQRERIRQIESKAMSKLRHPSRSKVLEDFMPDRKIDSVPKEKLSWDAMMRQLLFADKDFHHKYGIDISTREVSLILGLDAAYYSDVMVWQREFSRYRPRNKDERRMVEVALTAIDENLVAKNARINPRA